MKRLLVPLLLAFAASCNCSNVTEGKQPEICDNGRDDDGNGLIDCADGACFLNSHCFASCLDQCSSGEGVCDANGTRTCQRDSSTGCEVFAPAASCGTGKICQGGICTAPPCSDQCTAGSKQCAGLGLPVHCDTLASGCTDWVVDTPCGTGEACSAGTCVPRVQCMSDCPAVGDVRCTPDGKQQTCEGVAACHQWGLPVSCAGGACSCIPDSGAGGGGGGSATGGGAATGGGTATGGGSGGGTGGGSTSVACADGGLGCGAMQLLATEEGGCAVLENGGVECWGLLDVYTTFTYNPPTPIAIPFDAGYSLEGGMGTPCVRGLNGGGVYCWGREVVPNGQLTHYSTLDDGTRRVVGGPDYICAVRDDGGVDCWGGGVRINDGVTPDAYPFPSMVTTPSRVTGFNAEDEIALGQEFICAHHGPVLTCWGYNGIYGECYTGDQPAVRLPGFVEPQTHFDAGVNALTVSDRGVCVANDQGRVFCWGDQLGPSSPLQYRSCTAVEITGFDAPVTQLCSGGQYACALQSNGTVRCWGAEGFGSSGILGPDAGSDGYPLPLPIPALTGVQSISCGQAHACALCADRRVRCWGLNPYGALGVDDGGFVSSAVPVVVPL
jgi:hypothetical protein